MILTQDAHYTGFPTNLCQSLSSVVTAKRRISLNWRVKCECHVCFRIVFVKKLIKTCELCLRGRTRRLVVVYESERYGALRFVYFCGPLHFCAQYGDEVHYIASGALYQKHNPVLVWE